jgi:mRNA interferase MazF
MFRGEIWHMTLQKSGEKPAGSTRPVVIVSSDALGSIPLRVVVPLTSWKSAYTAAPWMVRVPPVLNSGLEQPHAADALQVRSVSISRLAGRLGELPEPIVAEIIHAISVVLENPPRAGI